jgi:hypothetical protein
MKHGRRDANHQEVKDAFTALGCSVADTADVGNGFPDLVVGIAGVTTLVEVKTPEGTHTPEQERFYSEWRGSHYTVRSREQAVDLVQSVRKGMKA